jgi:hypothetical protein
MPKYRVTQICYFNDAIRHPGDEIEVSVEVFDPTEPSECLELIEPLAKPKASKKPRVDENNENDTTEDA